MRREREPVCTGGRDDHAIGRVTIEIGREPVYLREPDARLPGNR